MSSMLTPGIAVRHPRIILYLWPHLKISVIIIGKLGRWRQNDQEFEARHNEILSQKTKTETKQENQDK
jgi:hypothetical protein